jgi:hypothetical protein
MKGMVKKYGLVDVRYGREAVGLSLRAAFHSPSTLINTRLRLCPSNSA